MTGGHRPRGSLKARAEHDMAERQARREKMLAEFRAAQQRRLVKQGMALWNQTEAAYMAATLRLGRHRQSLRDGHVQNWNRRLAVA